MTEQKWWERVNLLAERLHFKIHLKTAHQLLIRETKFLKYSSEFKYLDLQKWFNTKVGWDSKSRGWRSHSSHKMSCFTFLYFKFKQEHLIWLRVYFIFKGIVIVINWKIVHNRYNLIKKISSLMVRNKVYLHLKQINTYDHFMPEFGITTKSCGIEGAAGVLFYQSSVAILIFSARYGLTKIYTIFPVCECKCKLPWKPEFAHVLSQSLLWLWLRQILSQPKYWHIYV